MLNYVDFNQQNITSAARSESPQEAQPAYRLTIPWITRGDLEFVAKLTAESRLGTKKHVFPKSNDKNVLFQFMEKHIDMPNLLRMCIHSLLSHPIRFESVSIGSLPQEPLSLDRITQHNADQILRMAILDNKFAEGVRDQIHDTLRSPLASVLECAIPKKVIRKKKHNVEEILDITRDDISRALLTGAKCSQEETGLFCCAVVLLAVVGQRADYLRSGADIRQCLNDWPTVKLS